jgi:MFS family permease
MGRQDPPSRRLVWRREYGIFYAISALFGIRKQIFLVFGTWVLVSLHQVPVSTIALLYFIGAALGVLLRPLLGDVIDWLGERTVLSADTLLLMVICLVYAFASDLLPAPWGPAPALRRLCGGQRPVRAAGGAHHLPEEDRGRPDRHHADDLAGRHHRPLRGDDAAHPLGLALERYGHQWVFLLAAALALAGFFVCIRIRVPDRAVPVVAGAGGTDVHN